MKMRSFLVFTLASLNLQTLTGAEDDMTSDGDERSICGLGQFACSRTEPKQCLDRNLVCDENEDCDNGADETFETCEDDKGYHTYLLNSKVFNVPYLGSTEQRGRNDCVLTTYPHGCLCQFSSRLRCVSLGLRHVPSTSLQLTRLFLANNPISTITDHSISRYPNLEFLHMKNCSLHSITEDAFQGLGSLRRIYLDENMIKYLPPGLFMDQRSLMWLFLQENLLFDWPGQIFNLHTEDIGVWLNITSNNLKFENPEMFHGASSLAIIEAGYNSIEFPHPHIFNDLGTLGVLRLHRNQIRHLPDEIFDDLTSLVELDLSYNQLVRLKRRHFQSLYNLSKLALNNNPLQDLAVDFSYDLHHLSSIDLTGVAIPNIGINMFEKNQKLEFAYFRTFRYCSFVPHVRVCRPTTDGISTLNQLLVNPLLRVCVWFMALATCLGNVAVLISRSLQGDRGTPITTCIKYLCAADLVMGVYLLIIAIHDVRYRDVYNRYAHAWMGGWVCRMSGVLAMLSSEVSIITLTVLSLDRYNKVVHPFRTIKVPYVYILTIVWLVGIALAVMPLLMPKTFGNFYGSNGMCFPLHIHEPFAQGWEYSAFVFLALNSACIMMLSACYARMLSSVRATSNRCARTEQAEQEKSFALRMCAIVCTDAMCWIPILVVKTLALAGVEISDRVYSWLAVFALPINSSLNPILYTLTTSWFLGKMAALTHTLVPSVARRRRRSTSSSSRAQYSLESVKPERELDGAGEELMRPAVMPQPRQERIQEEARKERTTSTDTTYTTYMSNGGAVEI